MNWVQFQFLLRNDTNPNVIEEEYNSSPLYLTMSHNHERIVELLLANKANPNLLGSNSAFPLQKTVNKENVKIIGLLLKAGADPNLTTKGNFSALEIAYLLNNRKSMEVFLKCGSKIKPVFSVSHPKLEKMLDNIREGKAVYTEADCQVALGMESKINLKVMDNNDDHHDDL